MRPRLLLTGPPAAGKSTTALALAQTAARAAVIGVDDLRHLVVGDHAAPWEGDEGRLQQQVGVRNAGDLARRFRAAGIEVVLADFVTQPPRRVPPAPARPPDHSAAPTFWRSSPTCTATSGPSR